MGRRCEATWGSQRARLQGTWLPGTFSEMGPGTGGPLRARWPGSHILPQPPPCQEPRPGRQGRWSFPGGHAGPCLLLLPRCPAPICHRRCAKGAPGSNSLVRIKPLGPWGEEEPVRTGEASTGRHRHAGPVWEGRWRDELSGPASRGLRADMPKAGARLCAPSRPQTGSPQDVSTNRDLSDHLLLQMRRKGTHPRPRRIPRRRPGSSPGVLTASWGADPPPQLTE